MNKRAQAALEFLSTYGFAFLIILVMIGALAYFGVLNPNNLLPERCGFGSNFHCVDFRVLDVVGDPQVNFYLQNNLGEVVSIFQADMTMAIAGGGAAATSCAIDPTAVPLPDPYLLPAGGGQVEVQCDSFGAGGESTGPGSRMKFTVDFTYQTATGKYPHPAQGEIFAEVQ